MHILRNYWVMFAAGVMLLAGCSSIPMHRQVFMIPPDITPVMAKPVMPPAYGCPPFYSIVRPGARTEQVEGQLRRAGYVIAKFENDLTTWRCDRSPPQVATPLGPAGTSSFVPHESNAGPNTLPPPPDQNNGGIRAAATPPSPPSLHVEQAMLQPESTPQENQSDETPELTQLAEHLLPDRVTNRAAWAMDIVSALQAQHLPTTTENLCATMAVIGQESGFQVDPVVPNLPKIAWQEIEKRRESYWIPKILVEKVVSLRSTDGRTYKERLNTVRTERELSAIWEDLVTRIPIAQQKLDDANPIRSLGPMQVNIDFIKQHARQNPSTVSLNSDLRAVGFSRYGGIFYGVAHLLDYRAPYSSLEYRFADYNAGRYASRNAALPNAISQVSGIALVTDGVLLRDEEGKLPTTTMNASLSLGPRIGLDQTQILQTLKLHRSDALESTRFYVRVFKLAEQQAGHPMPRALLPQLKITGPKIQRTNLTTSWFVQRVDSRYRACLAHEAAQTEESRRKANKIFMAGW